MSKKKGGGQKKKKDGEEDFTFKLFRSYQKRCVLNGVTMLRQLKDKFDEEEDIETLHLYEEAGPMGTRALMDAMTEVQYPLVKSVRMWKVKAQDEGVRATCAFLEKNKTVKILEFMDNEVGPLGCEFIGRLMDPSIDSQIAVLKLDHNPFGTEGLAMLAKGLARNKVIQSLSLSFCNIDAGGAKYLQEILANIFSQLKELNLRGNRLKNEGIVQLCRVLEINSTLESIDLADNQFGEDEKVINSLCEVFQKSPSITSYNLKYNGITEEGVRKMVEPISKSECLNELTLNDGLPKELLAEIADLLKKNKSKKKKKGKGKKGKKK